MARPERDTIQSGTGGWDATANDNFIRIFDNPFAIHEHSGDESDLASTFAAASYDNSLVWVDHSVDGWSLYHSDGSTWDKFTTRFASSGAFTSLSDVPSSYTGQGLKGVRVNSGETGLEFYTISAGTTFVGLTDTPANFTGDGGKVVRVNSGETALEFSNPLEAIQVACSDESTAIDSTGTKLTFRMPYGFTLTAVRASLTGACTTGTFTVDINEGGTTILSTKLTIDATEKTSTTAATAPVISDASLASDAEITIDVDDVGDSTASGLKVTLIGRQS